MSFYIDVLRESVLTTAPVPFVGNPTFFAMLGFGGYNMLLATALALLGVIIGTSISYYIGHFMYKFSSKHAGDAAISSETYAKGARYFKRFFLPLLLVSWVPMFNFLAVGAGFLGQKFKLVIGLVLIGQVAYYGYHLYS